MPDSGGKLTQEEKQKIQHWLSEVGWARSPTCPVCGKGTWTIADHIVQPTTLGAGNSLQFGGISYPQVMLISQCGYTFFMNAVVIGLLSKAEPQDDG